MLAQKALPSRIWMATGKQVYNFVTRRLMNWSDGEGTEDRIARDGPAAASHLWNAGSQQLFSVFPEWVCAGTVERPGTA